MSRKTSKSDAADQVVKGIDPELEWIGSKCGTVSPYEYVNGVSREEGDYSLGDEEDCVFCDSPVRDPCLAVVRKKHPTGSVSSPVVMEALTLSDMLPTVLPPWWVGEGVSLTTPSGHTYPAYRYLVTRPRSPLLLVLVTLDMSEAGDWLHSSVSRKGALPSWADLKLVHEVIHCDRPVIQVMPPKSSWISIADCLHLFERLDAPTVPEQLWR